MSVERIRIMWDSGEYRVSKPSWDGGEVVMAGDFDALHCQRDQLLNAAKTMFELIDMGMLVRDTSRDHEPNWAIKQVPLVKGLKQLQMAIKAAEED